MKPVMYHYVRPSALGLPHFPYLALSSFQRQLDHFMDTYGIVGREAFLGWAAGGDAPDGVLLTFDDGLIDHTDHVLPELVSRGLFGLFYVPSGPITTGAFLDVHKIHLAVGRLGGEAALRWVALNHPELLPDIDCAEIGKYATQSSDKATKQAKWLFNWKLTFEERRAALDGLLAHAFEGEPPSWHDFYLDEGRIKALLAAGMGVGGHGQTHAILSHLSETDQRSEIKPSCDLVRSLVGHLDWGFCYAHGVADAFDRDSERIVEEAGWPFAFAVEDRDIEKSITAARRYALPRYNCNSFPHGIASFGVTPACEASR